MIERRHLLATALALGVGAIALLIGCRADVFVPDPAIEELVGEGPLGSYRYWTPQIRIIGADGGDLEDFTVSLSNAEYYRESFGAAPDPGADFRAETTYRVRDGEVDMPGTPILPPLVLSASASTVPLLLHDLAPQPGDTIVVDLRDPTHWVAVDIDPILPSMSSARVQLDLHYALGLETLPSSNGRASGALVFDGTSGVYPVMLSGATDEHWRTVLEWLGAVAGTRYDFPRVSLAPGDTLFVRPPLRGIWLDVREAGEPASVMNVMIETGRQERPTAEFTLSRTLNGAPTLVPVHESPFSVRIEGEASKHFVARDRFFDVADGDTVLVDLGAHRVRVRVEDPDGRPLRARQVFFDSSSEYRSGHAELVTGVEG